MAQALDALLDRTARRLRDDDGFADALAVLVAAPLRADPSLRAVALHAVNQQRRRAAREAFMAGALTTAQMQSALGLGTPQAVHRLRSRGRLIGHTVGNATWFPAWQLSGGALRSDLSRVLAELRRFGPDVPASDRIMRFPHADLDGLSIAEALDDEQLAPVAWILLQQGG